MYDGLTSREVNEDLLHSAYCLLRTPYMIVDS